MHAVVLLNTIVELYCIVDIVDIVEYDLAYLTKADLGCLKRYS